MVVEIASQCLVQSCPVVLCRNIWWESGNSLRQQNKSLTNKPPAWTILDQIRQQVHPWQERFLHGKSSVRTEDYFLLEVCIFQSGDCLLRWRTRSHPSRKALTPFSSILGMTMNIQPFLTNWQEESVMVYTPAHLVECLPVVKKTHWPGWPNHWPGGPNPSMAPPVLERNKSSAFMQQQQLATVNSVIFCVNYNKQTKKINKKYSLTDLQHHLHPWR